MDPTLRTFLFGASGSAVVEVFLVVRAFEKGRIPARYFKVGYWAFRIGLVAGSGLLALAYGVQSDILAFHIGATAPALLQSLIRSPPELGQAAPAPAAQPPATLASPVPGPEPPSPPPTTKPKAKPPKKG